MFETVRLLPSSHQSIELQTRLGNSIENLIELDPGEPERRKFERLVERYGANWTIRRACTGRYNCAGLVFANRRTSIFKPALYLKILEDDGYSKLANPELLFPGDIVSYVCKRTGEIDHLAQIVFLRPGLVGSTRPIPWALSKWNSATGEVIHSIYDAAFDLSECRIEFWTDRPI